MREVLISLLLLHFTSGQTVQKIRTSICPSYWAVTKGEVSIELRVDGESCKTKINSGNWNTGGEEVFDGPALGSCASFKASSNEIQTKLVMEDGVQLCSILVEMGDGSKIPYTYENQTRQTQNLIVGKFYNLTRFDKELDQMLAPNSHKAEVKKISCPLPFFWPFNGDPCAYFGSSHPKLEDKAISFNKLEPTLVIRRFDKNAAPKTVMWNDLREMLRHGNFGEFVKKNLKKELGESERLVFITHGFMNDIDLNDHKELRHIANKIEDYENAAGKGRKKTTAILFLWNSVAEELVEDYIKRKKDKKHQDQHTIKWALDKFHHFIGPKMNLCYVDFLTMHIPTWARLLMNRWFVPEFMDMDFYEMSASTGKLGELLAGLIKSIRTEYPKITYVHGIGHSLGAHIMGNVKNFGNVKIDRISGLDPAGPCFEKGQLNIHIIGNKWGLHKESAKFVDNLHTERTVFGTEENKGDLDIIVGDPNKDRDFPNGPPNKNSVTDGVPDGYQPNCPGFLYLLCGHMRAWHYYNNSILESEKEKYKTSYQTEGQDDNSNYIGPSDGTQLFAGYHADEVEDKLGDSGFKRRRYLPIFKQKGADNGCGVNDKEIDPKCIMAASFDVGYAMNCDLPQLSKENQDWCMKMDIIP